MPDSSPPPVTESMPETTLPLPSEILAIEGPDAGRFMHGQFTSDVIALREGTWQFSAWLDASGRVHALFHLARLAEQRWMLLLRGGTAENLKAALQRYVFRARVDLEPLAAGTLSARPATTLHAAIETDDGLQLGAGDHSIISGRAAPAPGCLREIQIRNGWPWLAEGSLGQYNAAALGLHHLGAIALDKGCYPGQEIVARLHYRGGNKRRLCRVILSQDVGRDARLKQTDDGAEIHVLDVVKGDTGVHGLAVAHEEWIAASEGGRDVTSTDGTRIRIIESWRE